MAATCNQVDAPLYEWHSLDGHQECRVHQLAKGALFLTEERTTAAQLWTLEKKGEEFNLEGLAVVAMASGVLVVTSTPGEEYCHGRSRYRSMVLVRGGS